MATHNADDPPPYSEIADNGSVSVDEGAGVPQIRRFDVQTTRPSPQSSQAAPSSLSVAPQLPPRSNSASPNPDQSLNPTSQMQNLSLGTPPLPQRSRPSSPNPPPTTFPQSSATSEALAPFQTNSPARLKATSGPALPRRSSTHTPPDGPPPSHRPPDGPPPSHRPPDGPPPSHRPPDGPPPSHRPPDGPPPSHRPPDGPPPSHYAAAPPSIKTEAPPQGSPPRPEPSPISSSNTGPLGPDSKTQYGPASSASNLRPPAPPPGHRRSSVGSTSSYTSQASSHASVHTAPQHGPDYHFHAPMPPPPPPPPGRPQLRYPKGYFCPKCHNTGIKIKKGTTCQDCFERFGVRQPAQYLPAGVSPVFQGPPRVVQPGDPSIGGWLCGRCRGSGIVRDLLFFESTCPICHGVGRVF